jgi:hypothetical protein
MSVFHKSFRAVAVAGALVAMIGLGEAAQAQTPPARPAATEAAPSTKAVHAGRHHVRKHHRLHRRHGAAQHKSMTKKFHRTHAKPAKS